MSPSRCPDSDPSNRLVDADFLFREEPDEEEEDEQDEHNEEDDDEGEDDGYSE